MSTPPSTSQLMASHSGDFSNADSFLQFFHLWTAERRQLLKELTSAAASPTRSDPDLRSLTNRVLLHYERYNRAKSNFARRDVLAVLAPTWLSQLETAFLWIGGWRPSAAFHLLYSKSGLQFSARLGDLIRGDATYDLGDLSPSQLGRVDSVQRETLEAEREITESMAAFQETAADSSMVEMSQAVVGGRGSLEDRVDSVLAVKEEGLREILQRAGDLRLRTLRSLIDVLSPIQAVHFLIAAVELLIKIHDWGEKRDDEARNQAH